MIRAAIVALGVMVFGTRSASAQYNVPSQASGESRSNVMAEDDEPQPRDPSTAVGWELGASIDFLTSQERSLRDRQVEFTDVVLFRTHGLVAIGKRLELFAGVDLLPKQPSYADEHRWQGALLGARARLTKIFSAYTKGAFGPNLDHDGFWLMAETAVQYKRDLAERILFWESAVGVTYTQLFFDEPVDRMFRQTELLTQTGLAIRDKKGFFATWLAFTFHFPLLASPATDDPDPTRGVLDPQVRVGMSLGALVGVSRTLDLFIEATVLDRGDLEDSSTTLPILSGGFDQSRILFGFNRRFGKRRR